MHAQHARGRGLEGLQMAQFKNLKYAVHVCISSPLSSCEDVLNISHHLVGGGRDDHM